MHEPRCAICADIGKREAVNRALLAGEKPADVLRTLGGTLGISASSLYRHARGHVQGGTVPTWLGDSTLGDVVADLSRLRSATLEQHAEARAAGNYSASERLAGRVESITKSMIQLAISDEAAEHLEYAERVQRNVSRTATRYPDVADAHARTARADGLTAMADDFDFLAATAREHATQKENR